MKIEVCDLCKKDEPNKRFKIRMSSKGQIIKTNYGAKYISSLWQPYKKISVCDSCAKKLFAQN